LLPIVLAYVVIVAGTVLALDASGMARGPVFGAILFGINLVLMGVILFVLDKGRLVSPAYARLAQERVARLRAASAGRSTIASGETR
ncbi:MAG: hypothetical protein U9Q74_09675, partial [Gemmatimonadota bacterium]|nr:hypothetical protein [Gemmatimonadota bacterium]